MLEPAVTKSSTQLTNHVLTMQLNKYEISTFVYLDLSKAFDTIDRFIIFDKLLVYTLYTSQLAIQLIVNNIYNFTI